MQDISLTAKQFSVAPFLQTFFSPLLVRKRMKSQLVTTAAIPCLASWDWIEAVGRGKGTWRLFL